MGTAMMSAMADETSVPKMNVSAPNCSLTGSQSLVTRKCQPNFWSASLEPLKSSRPMSAMSTKMESAMSSVNHLNARSPNCPVRFMSGGFCFAVSITIVWSKIFPAGLRCRAAPISGTRGRASPPRLLKLKGRRARGTALFVRLTPAKIPGGGAKSVFYCLDPLQNALLDAFGQRRVVECCRHPFAFGQSPIQKFDQFFALGGVLLLFINQQPRRAGSRIRFLARRIEHRETEVIGDFRRGERRRDRIERGGDEIASRVLYIGVCHFVLFDINQFNIADGARHLFDLASDAFIALAAESNRPFDRCALANRIRPNRTDVAQVINEDIGRAAAVGTMNHDNRQIPQIHIWIERGALGIVPFRDIAHENVDDGITVQFQLGISRQIVSDDIRAGDGGNVQEFPRRFGEVFIAHRAIGGAEVHGSFGDLFLAAAGTDGLVVEADRRVHLGVFVEPL